MPFLERLDRSLMFQCALRNVVVVNFEVVAQSRLELGGRTEAGLIDDLADAAVEAFDHAVSLRMARWNKAMLDRQVFAEHVERVLASRYAIAADGVFLPAGEAVGELAAVVGEQLDDVDRAGVFHLDQEVSAAAVGLVGIDFHEDPTGCAIDGDKQITSRSLVGHLRQILDVYMEVARFVVLERLLGRGLLALEDRDQIAQV